MPTKILIFVKWSFHIEAYSFFFSCLYLCSYYWKTLQRYDGLAEQKEYSFFVVWQQFKKTSRSGNICFKIRLISYRSKTDYNQNQTLIFILLTVQRRRCRGSFFQAFYPKRFLQRTLSFWVVDKKNIVRLGTNNVIKLNALSQAVLLRFTQWLRSFTSRLMDLFHGFIFSRTCGTF